MSTETKYSSREEELEALEKRFAIEEENYLCSIDEINEKWDDLENE